MSAAALEPLVERWFAALRPKLVVWDFDLTILNTHAFGEGVEVEQVPHRWHADVLDVDLMRAFVGAATSKGVAVGIASFGRQEVRIANHERRF
jgi:hypothetical protein